MNPQIPELINEVKKVTDERDILLAVCKEIVNELEWEQTGRTSVDGYFILSYDAYRQIKNAIASVEGNHEN